MRLWYQSEETTQKMILTKQDVEWLVLHPMQARNADANAIRLTACA